MISASVMAVDFLNAVLEHHKENQWENLLQLNENSDCLEALKILWVWPSIDNLKFIKENVLKYGKKGVISLGCGSGLLEWFIHKATDLPVIGYEVNESWWKSKYSCPQFIQLQYSPEIPDKSMFNPEHALLFCYFNNRPAFNDYIKCYEGNMVIIIGPGEGAGRHTDPEPFNPRFECLEWVLEEHQEIKNSKDFIAVYIRKHN